MTNTKNIDFIGLYGPTAIGKTALAMDVSQSYPVEIISVDSALVYQEMDIGTGKPSPEEQALCPHHLIDVVKPHETYTVGQFYEQASQLIAKIKLKGKIPLLVGGTGLYFESLTKGYSKLPKISAEVSTLTNQILEQNGLEYLHKKLIEKDDRHQILHVNDTQRITRAFNVLTQTGQAIYDFWDQQKPTHTGQIICMRPTSRDNLDHKIKKRLINMIAQGLIDEVAYLIEKYNLNENHNSMRCVGYKQTYQYLLGKCSIKELEDLIFFATRQYAKRQITWQNRWQEEYYIYVNEHQAKNKLNSLIENLHK